MIALIAAMIRTRPARAVVVGLLAMLAVASAVSPTAYREAAQRTVATDEVAAAPLGERLFSADYEWAAPDLRRFDQEAPGRLTSPGFTSIAATETTVRVSVGDRSAAPRLVYRDDFCAHLRITAGRCVMGAGEVVIGAKTAAHLGAQVGQPLPVAYAEYRQLESGDYAWVAVRVVAPLTIVGIFEPVDAGEAYWARRPYFVRDSGDRNAGEPLFATRATVRNLPHRLEQSSIDLIAGPELFDRARLAELRETVDELDSRATALDARTDTAIPALIDRIERGSTVIDEVVPVAALPLVALCWFVLYVAIGYSALQRRRELGLLALRGVSFGRRALLGIGESLAPIVIAAPLGYLLGHLGIEVITAFTLSAGGDVPITTEPLRPALIAVAGALVAGLLAQRRALSGPVVSLLRDVPARTGRWQSYAGAGVVVLLALLAVAQLRLSGGVLLGLGQLTPALVIAAVAVVTAPLLGPAADLIGRRALRRGRLGTALAALDLARRPGAHRLMALAAVAVALLSFAAIGLDVAANARDQRTLVEVGADRVITVAPVSRQALLRAVRATDPEGRYAMAVAEAGRSQADEPAKLAVDSSRLAVAAKWPGGGSGAAEMARKLRGKAPREPVVIRSRQIVVEADLFNVTSTPFGLQRDEPVVLNFSIMLAPLDGTPLQQIRLGTLNTFGDRRFTAETPACAQAGCRLAGFVVSETEARPFGITLTIKRLLGVGPDSVLIDGAGFSAPDAWRAPEATRLDTRGLSVRGSVDGLSVASVPFPPNQTIDGIIMPGDVPYPLPVASAGEPAPRLLNIADGSGQRTTQVGPVDVLPRLGVSGILVDLEYVDRLSRTTPLAERPEVWLGPAAPADVAQRLTEAGLTVTGERRPADLLRTLRYDASAVALRFHVIAGALGLVLAVGVVWLVAGVDRAGRMAELGALRVQGLPVRAATAAAGRGYAGVVAAAVLIGLLAAFVAWLAAGSELPLFTDRSQLVPPPRWPRPQAGLTWLAAAVLLFAAAGLAGGGLRRALKRREP